MLGSSSLPSDLKLPAPSSTVNNNSSVRSHLEVLIYNVSHADLQLSFPRVNNIEEGGESGEQYKGLVEVLAKPKFSEYDRMSNQIFKSLKENNTSTKPKILTMTSVQGREFPIGFELVPETIGTFSQMHCVSHWRHGDSTAPPDGDAEAKPKSLYLPLIACIVPKWIDTVESRHPGCRKLIILISGTGTPRNPEHSSNGNSTVGTAKIIEYFLKTSCHNVEVKKVHGGTGVFRFHDNIKFVNQQLRPAMEEERRAVSKDWGGEDWLTHLRVTIAMCDGAPARVSAINSGLREYKPDFLHMWQLKSFWYYGLFDEDDVDWISFNDVEMSPAIPVSELPELERLLVEEMKLHKQKFERIRDSGRAHELEQFWLRKSKKLVLSALMVQKEKDEPPIFYRGTNMEVSMPTGSLCSERNVIGTALAADCTLHRHQLRMIAVLSVTLQPKVTSTSPTFGSNSSLPPPFKRPRTTYNKDLGHYVSPGISTNSSPLRTSNIPKHRGEAGLNPTSPCGSCMEWLKKIAELNPDFKIITFTSEACDEVYINSVQ